MSTKNTSAETAEFNDTKALENKLKKKRNKKKKIAVIIISALLALMLVIGLTGVIWLKTDMKSFVKFAFWLFPDDFVVKVGVWLMGDTYADLPQYDDGTSEWSDPLGDDYEKEDAPTVEPPKPEQEPEFEEIEGWFDGTNVSDDYEDKVHNILLIGADTLDGTSARSDTMMLLSINTEKKRLVITSFMRDSYVDLPGKGYNRLNAAHSRGGPQYLIETIQHNFGIKIDNYAKVDFTSFKEAVDSINGIDVIVNEHNYEYFSFHKFPEISGLSQAQACDGSHVIHMDGKTALGYVRARNKDFDGVSGGDFGRTQRQRDFLIQFVNNCKTLGFNELDALLKTLLPYIVTDMPSGEIKGHMYEVMDYIKYDLSDTRVPCAGSWEYYKTERGAEVLNINIPANAAYVKAKIYG